MCDGAELYRQLAKNAVRTTMQLKELQNKVLSEHPDDLGAKDLIYLYGKLYYEQMEIAEMLGIKANGMTGSLTGKTRDFMYRKLLEEVRNDESRISSGKRSAS